MSRYLFPLRLSDWIEDLVLIDVACVLVVMVVGQLPRVVRDHDQAVQQVAELQKLTGFSQVRLG